MKSDYEGVSTVMHYVQVKRYTSYYIIIRTCGSHRQHINIQLVFPYISYTVIPSRVNVYMYVQYIGRNLTNHSYKEVSNTCIRTQFSQPTV